MVQEVAHLRNDVQAGASSKATARRVAHSGSGHAAMDSSRIADYGGGSEGKTGLEELKLRLFMVFLPKQRQFTTRACSSCLLAGRRISEIKHILSPGEPSGYMPALLKKIADSPAMMNMLPSKYKETLRSEKEERI